MGLFDFLKRKKTESSEKPNNEENKTQKGEYKEFELYCPKCGAGLKNGTRYCTNCGKDLTEGKTITSSQRTVETPSGTAKITFSFVALPPGVKDVGKYTKNGITYHQLEHHIGDNGCYTICAPEYNEVYFFFIFLNKYPIIRAPQYAEPGDYSNWYFTSLGIYGYRELHKLLVEKGFYSRAKNDEILSTYKIGEIKDAASQLGVKIKGKKEELIDQLVSQADETALTNLLGDKIQSISDFGKQWMSDHMEEYKFYISEKEFSSFDAYKEFWSTHDPEEEARKEAKANISKLLSKIRNDKKYFGEDYYHELISEYEFLGNCEKKIMICLLKELLVELSGAQWYALGCNDIGNGTHYIIIHKVTRIQIRGYSKYYDESMIDEVYDKTNLPFNVCDKRTFKEIVEMIIDDSFDEETEKEYKTVLCDKLRSSLNK